MMKAIPLAGQDVSYGSRPLAAVGVITCRRPTESILLVRRVRSDGDPWSGHFAFPGGRREERDPSLFATCIREVREETGVELDSSMLLRPLAPTAAGRRSREPLLVQPYVFELRMRPAVVVEEKEITAHFWLETACFQDISNHTVTEVLPGLTRPIFPLDDYYIWGFTYNILCRLLLADSTVPQ